jgi:hypothetical protein
VVALGDSYSAGEGLGCYDPNTDTSADECHRSSYAYSNDVLPSAIHLFVACSGATTDNIWDKANGSHYGEQAQINYVGGATTATLTIGGNDAGFDGIAQSCASILETSPTSQLFQDLGGSYADGSFSGNCANWINHAESLVGTGSGPLELTLESTYEKILMQLSPTAQLLVGTYPQVFPEPGSYGGIGGFCAGPSLPLLVDGIPVVVAVGYTASDVASFNTVESNLNEAIRNAISAIHAQGDTRIQVVDLYKEIGDHAISCGDTGRPTPYINNITLAPGAGIVSLLEGKPSISNFVSLASFHPNTTGQLHMGTEFDSPAGQAVPLSVVAPDPSETSAQQLVPSQIGVQAVGGNGSSPVWSVSSGSLPPGMTLSQHGINVNSALISGAPASAGTYRFTLKASQGSSTSSRSLTISVASSAPCTIMAASGLGDSWSDPGSWYQNRTPGPGDVACIGDTSMSVSGTESVGAVIGKLGALDVSGQLRLTDTAVASDVENLYVSGALTPSAGVTVNIEGTDLINSGYAQLQGGILGGPGTVVISTASTLEVTSLGGTLGGALVNNGTLGIEGTFSINGSLTSNGVITGSGNLDTTNSPTGLLTVAAGGVITTDGGLQINLPVDYQGTIIIPAGTSMSLTYSTNGGTWTGAGTLYVDTTLTNPVFSGLGALTIYLNATLSTPGPLTLPPLTLLAGTLAVPGTVTVPDGATLQVDGHGDCFTGGPATTGPMVIDGTLDLDAGCPVLALGGALTNNGTIEGSGTIEAGQDPAPTLTNNGSIAPSPASGYTDGAITLNVPVANNGTVTIGATDQVTAGGATAPGGTWTGGGTLTVSGSLAAPVISGLSTLDVSGIVSSPVISDLANLYIFSGTVTSPGPLTLPTASLTVVYGTLSTPGPLTLPPLTLLAGTLAVPGTVTVPDGATLQVDGHGDCFTGGPATTGPMVIDGTLDLDAGCPVLALGGALTNNGTIEGSGTIEAGQDPAPTLTNNGSIAPSPASGYTDGAITLNVPVANNGTVTIGATDQVTVSSLATGGAWTGPGTLYVASGSSFVTPDSMPAVTQLSGTFGAPGLTSTVSPGATLKVGCPGGSTAGTVVNEGTIELGNCNLELGGALVNDGTIDGTGSITSALSPLPTLTEDVAGTIGPMVTIGVPLVDQPGRFQSIKFKSSPPTNPTVGGDYKVSATGGGSGVPLVFSSGQPSVCTVSGATVRFVDIGTCIVDANEAGNTKYAPAPTATQSFVVGGSSRAITSAASVTVAPGSRLSFTITTSGSPTPKITEEGNLPKKINFNSGRGTASLAGVAKRGTSGAYPITVIATFGKGKTRQDVTQSFVLTIT